MAWDAMIPLFFLSFIKFMFAPLGGPGMGLTFLETYIACVAGGIIGSAIFYYSAEYFMHRSKRKQIEKNNKHIALGKPVVVKKNFTRMNKFVLKIKRTFGQIGISLWAPFFLSVPIGSIITAKFYGEDKKTFPLIVVGMLLNGLITTSISFFIYG